MDVIKDGNEYTADDLVSTIGERLNLSGDDLGELAPNGRTSQLRYRIWWAKSQLKKAGLVRYPTRGRVIIVKKKRASNNGNKIRYGMPTFEDMMLPLLYEIEGGGEYMNNLEEAVAKRLGLSKGVLNTLTPNSRMTQVRHRLGWAKSYLKKAGLVQYPSRGRVVITENGKKLLKSNPSRINRRGQKVGGTEVGHDGDGDRLTPEEIVDLELKKIDRMLNDELLEKVKGMTPRGFELMVLDLCKKLNGGGEVEHTGKSGDGGVDGIVYDGGLGLDKTYVQAKRHKQKVTSENVRAFIGAVTSNATKKGVFITTANISNPARKEAKKSHVSIRLVEDNELVRLMVKHNAGVTVSRTLTIKKMDEGYFEDFG